MQLANFQKMSSPPVKDSTHGWSVADFELYRPWLSSFVRNEVCPRIDAAECRRLVVRAPVKSGKREMVEYLAMRDYSNAHNREHYFISAWYRVADDDQRKELKLHNLHVHAIKTRKDADNCRIAIQNHLTTGKTCIIHLDECDHGSGERQNLGKIYSQLRNQPSAFFILYSATPQEVLFSGDINMDEEQLSMLDDLYNEGEYVEYVPPEGFCGPAAFLEKGLLNQAKPFFTIDPTPSLSIQAKSIITGMLTQLATGSQRNFIVLRLSYKDGLHKNDKAIYKFLKHIDSFPELAAFRIWVDKDDISFDGLSPRVRPKKIEWSNKDSWDDIISSQPYLIVHDQTASRSTEWACHHRLFATHDYRTTIQYGVVSQAQERPNHYFDASGRGKYSEFQRIHIYGHVPTFKLSAGLISYTEYLNPPWEMKKTGDLYEIKNVSNGALHPAHQHPLSREEAVDVLMELGCAEKPTLSSRVIGNVRNVPIVQSEFVACNKDTWWANIAQLKNSIRNGRYISWEAQNPFENTRRLRHINYPNGLCPETGKEIGYLRVWGVYDYQTVENTADHRGVTESMPRQVICYKNGVLGVALRWQTGQAKLENRLASYKSIYPASIQ